MESLNMWWYQKTTKIEREFVVWGRVLLFVVIMSLLASCAFIDRVIDTPDITIERVTTKSGQITSAYLVEYRNQVFLRGRVRGRIPSKSTLWGHVDVEIASPNAQDYSCGTARYRNPPRTFRKPFSYWLGVVPEPNTIIRVWHHRDKRHSDCRIPEV